MAISTIVSGNGLINNGVVTTSLNGSYYRNTPGDTYADLRQTEALLDARYKARPFWEQVVADSGACASGVNANAVIYYPAILNQRHVVGGLAWSYNSTPIGGFLSIESGSGNFIMRQDITAAGAGDEDFHEKNKCGLIGQPLIITLGSGGSGVKGFINVKTHWLE